MSPGYEPIVHRPDWLSDRPADALGHGGVRLRPWSGADGPQLLLAVLESLQELSAWMPWATEDYGPDNAAWFVDHAQAAREVGAEFLYAVVDDRDEILGSCGLHPRVDPGGLEVGYWVHTAHTGRGVATRAAAALTGAAFDLEEVTHVEIRHDEANHRSAAVPRRLGFAHVATRRSEPDAPRGSGVEVLWRMTRSAWAGSPGRRLVSAGTDTAHS